MTVTFEISISRHVGIVFGLVGFTIKILISAKNTQPLSSYGTVVTVKSYSCNGRNG